VSNKRVDEVYDIVSAEADLVIGTAPGENVTDRSAMRFGFEAEGITIRSREAHRYEEGSLGWVVDQPRFGFPDGSGMDCRVTAILHNENGTWRLVHAHFSVGVPDDEVATLQERWSRLESLGSAAGCLACVQATSASLGLSRNAARKRGPVVSSAVKKMTSAPARSTETGNSRTATTSTAKTTGVCGNTDHGLREIRNPTRYRGTSPAARSW
jgi:hypothetical protein